MIRLFRKTVKLLTFQKLRYSQNRDLEKISRITSVPHQGKNKTLRLKKTLLGEEEV